MDPYKYRPSSSYNTSFCTTNSGLPVWNNNSALTVGTRGPILLEDYHLIEKIAAFHRERIPERVVHARGASAKGFFEVTHDITHLTCADFLRAPGVQTPLIARFSTVIHERGSPETIRDPRGFAIKFYTREGNWDLVGNNFPIFFIRDGMKFPDVIHAFKPNPKSHIQENWRILDFCSHHPESLNTFAWFYDDVGIPLNYRHMEGFGVHTYTLINKAGKVTYVKFHWKPTCGIKNLMDDEAVIVGGKNHSHATKDLYDSISAGNYPEWKLFIQTMDPADEDKFEFDPLDVTQIWPEDIIPLQPVGRMVLNRNIDNFFAENEQLAFAPSLIVPGIYYSDDKMLQCRIFAYNDTQRHRLGPNYLMLPVNAPMKVDAYVHVGSRALPTIPNFIFNMTEAFLRQLRIFPGRRKRLLILDSISGILRPSRMTLLLGPPSSGKTTLLLALAGRLGSGLQTSGSVTYNGHGMKEFVPQRTSAYVSQQDWHVPEMTVRETLEFSGRCQGVGIKYDMLLELSRREKNAGIKPDEDLDIFMKALALGGEKTSLVVEYIMKILGLDVCADTLVGDEMLKGISGGQKKRLSTGELLVGPARVLFMDEISNGLDSSTTHQIIKYLRHLTHALDGTTVISLLQPAPETYELFDDIILLCEGQIVYQGPRVAALDFFAFMGFRCPERKNVADFLQEVTSKKDQQQYWYILDRPYQYVPVVKFAEAFHSFHVGKRLSEELAIPFDRRHNHPAALSTSCYGVRRAELFKTSFSWQLLLMKRNSFIYVFKFIQLLFVALITMTVFFRTRMHHNSVDDGVIYLGALYFAIIMILFNGFTEVSMLIAKLPVIYKHRDLHFYPCWIYAFPSWVLSIPTSLVESGIWVGVTYYVIGFDPQITRFFRQFLLFFFLHQMSIALFRLTASLGRNMIVANTFGSFSMLVVMVLGGFILTRDSIPSWWIWGYWFSPLMYAQNAASVNEFLGHSWAKKVWNYTNNMPLGEVVLKTRGFFRQSYWYWIGVGALLGYTAIFNALLNFSLTYLNPLGKPQAVVSKEELRERDSRRQGENHSVELRSYMHSSSLKGITGKEQRGMVLPFQPLSMCFSNINYYVDVPVELKQRGILEDRLQLLINVTGAFRPGVLTALVGVSGAGKTTLMDVLAGRKTGGLIEGSITIAGHPKNQETFARISGYCEQNDVHSPCMTVLESLLYSAWLRLPSDVDLGTQRVFVEEVMELVELTPLSGALVGLPGVDGLSTEQRKRLTIAVELVANPSIVFMDEPTSGLDARSAAIVMRTVRNIVDTGRTIVCTIHQPSIDIFESFDELLFMKRGGQLIYAGPLGNNSHKLVEYFEAIEGVPNIRPGYNPAAWMLEVTSTAQESRLGVDFAEVYRRSNLFQKNRELVERLSRPNGDTKDLNFPTKYSQPFRVQFLACLWKQNLSYWRNPQYTAVRFFYTVIISLMFGSICWRFGSKREIQQDVMNAMGSMYAAVLFIGITNATAVQPVVSIERFVSYRERAAGMYSALPFAFAQVAIEFPYVFVQTLIYGSVFYSMASFEWAIEKFLWYIFFMYCTLLYFTFFGMMTTAVTPNHSVAPIIAAPFYMLWNLFCGFMIPHKRLPGWWRWYYWANPIAWSLYGLLTSQYGDVDEPMKLWDGNRSVPIRQFLKENFGFRHDYLGIAGFMVAGFCVIFAVIFAFAIKYFNFQRR